MTELQESDAIIAIVDDDPSVRRGLERLIRSVGWKAETFGREKKFGNEAGTACATIRKSSVCTGGAGGFASLGRLWPIFSHDPSRPRRNSWNDPGLRRQVVWCWN